MGAVLSCLLHPTVVLQYPPAILYNWTFRYCKSAQSSLPLTRLSHDVMERHSFPHAGCWQDTKKEQSYLVLTGGPLPLRACACHHSHKRPRAARTSSMPGRNERF